MKKTYIAPETQVANVDVTCLQATSYVIDTNTSGDEMLTKEHTPAPSWSSGSVWNEW